MWHQILLFLGVRDEFDWAPPCLGPEVNHPYFQHEALRCCDHCGGGWKHPIHQKPYNERREAEVMAIEHQKVLDKAVKQATAAYVERESGRVTAGSGTDYTGI